MSHLALVGSLSTVLESRLEGTVSVCVNVLPSGFGRKDVVDHLLQMGANVHARDDGGLIPLHNACSFGHSEVRRFTPLHLSDSCSYFSDYKFPRSSSLVSRRQDL